MGEKRRVWFTTIAVNLVLRLLKLVPNKCRLILSTFLWYCAMQWVSWAKSPSPLLPNMHWSVIGASNILSNIVQTSFWNIVAKNWSVIGGSNILYPPAKFSLPNMWYNKNNPNAHSSWIFRAMQKKSSTTKGKTGSTKLDKLLEILCRFPPYWGCISILSWTNMEIVNGKFGIIRMLTWIWCLVNSEYQDSRNQS